MKRLIAFIMAITLTISSVGIKPKEIKAEEEIEKAMVLGETNRQCMLRTQPYKNAEVVAELPEDTLVYLEGNIVNELGNNWFEISYFGKTTYCFSENISNHEHVYDVLVDDGSDQEVYACKCGAIEEEINGTTNTFVPAIAAPVIAETVKDLAFLAGVYLGSRIVAKHVLPIMVTEAGSVVTITKEKFDELLAEKNSEDNSEGKKYFKATILTKEDADSLELIDYEYPLSLDEACDYVDSLLQMNGAYGRLNRFSINACNIYTSNNEDAEELCQKIIGCQRNSITKYGNKKGISRIFDLHSQKYVNGSYLHYHLFRFDDKSIVHILFGNPISLITDIPEI